MSLMHGNSLWIIHHGHFGTVHLLQVIKTMMKIVASLNNVALASKQVGDFFLNFVAFSENLKL